MLWGMSQLHLPQYLRDQLGLLANLGYPHETCGILFGKQAHGHVSVQRVEQLAHPDPDPAEEPFDLDPVDLIQAGTQAQRHGLEVVGIWRALPDRAHVPGERERRTAWPDYSYLVLSVTPSGVSELHSWRLDRSQFTEEELQL